MGYKLAGCDVIAANDIDPEMAWHYKHNLHPRIYYLCPIKDLLTANLEYELFNLDILDGSPPCSTFSTSGNREKDWGKEKHFREGQCKQVLSDLFFDFLDLAARLKPKVVIAENVKGLIMGNAKGYVKLIFARLKEIGYRPQLFLLNAADCGVPQVRERVFFIALRNDIEKPNLVLSPMHQWISAKTAISDIKLMPNEIVETKPTGTDLRFWKETKEGDSYDIACKRQIGKESFFSHYKLNRNYPARTLTAQCDKFNHWEIMRSFCYREIKRFGSFPDDYYAKNASIGKYMVGMSVPPRMTEVVARAVCLQWL